MLLIRNYLCFDRCSVLLQSEVLQKLTLDGNKLFTWEMIKGSVAGELVMQGGEGSRMKTL